MINKKIYGEFKCPECGDIFFEKKKLDGHYGGKHRRDITKGVKTPSCKFCKRPLTTINWPEWARKQHNLICNICKREQNKAVYRNRLASKLIAKGGK